MEIKKAMNMFVALFAIILLLFAGCQKDGEENSQIANPAATYCIEQGGKYDIREGEKGQYGVCILKDGKECDAWEYFRGECPVNNQEISSFEECVERGNPIIETYPRQCKAQNKTFTEKLSLKDSCENLFGGKWLEQFNECEGISKENCDSMSGVFDGCASACRHDPGAQVCTMQCVLVCSFE